jgi:protocatechuate 3,4-dioxygenase beta subunit
MSTRDLDRRDALVMLGVGALGIAAAWRTARAAATPAGDAVQCVLAPEQTEGPFHVPNELVRRDLTEGRAGVPLRLVLSVRDMAGCRPIRGADVELWHCDAEGVYSGVADTERFLRGHQTTNARGKVVFDTIYPGWYTGRTPHIHVKVHVGGDLVHTGQLYFDDAVSPAVYGRAPYAARGVADTTNTTDFIYAAGGAESTLRLRRRGKGYRGRLALGVVA